MKKIILITTLIFFSGCTTLPEKVIVKVPVWSPPNVTLPVKPILTSDGRGTNGEVARKMSQDLILMRQYNEEIEKILKSLLSQPDKKP